MKTLILVLILVNTLFAFHKHESKENPKDQKLLDKLEVKLKYVYDKLNNSSKFVDELLTDEKIQENYYDSFIRVEYFYKIQSKEENDSKFDVDIKFKLPKLKDKLSVQFTNRDKKINEEYSDSNEESLEKDNKYSIGLLYDTFKNQYNLKVKAGVKLTSSPYLFVETKAQREFKINYNSNIIVKEKLKYSSKNKLDNYTSFEYKYRFNSKTYTANYFEYNINSEDKDNNFYTSVRLNKSPSKTKYINYVASYNSSYDNDYKSNEYKIYSSYRKYIRKWLYYDLVPEIQWTRNNNFDENYAFKINLGVLIGK